jgi:hypothetical protein
MARKNPTKEYEIIVKVGPSGSKEDGSFGWDSIKSFYRFGRWDADMKADEERRANPSAVICIRPA